ncbi:unnamed protein product [Symbiodinium sp. CCMP2456]|nr:unnamed protein product [Symbiodinium sp. CCMP2456]
MENCYNISQAEGQTSACKDLHGWHSNECVWTGRCVLCLWACRVLMPSLARLADKGPEETWTETDLALDASALILSNPTIANLDYVSSDFIVRSLQKLAFKGWRPGAQTFNGKS